MLTTRPRVRRRDSLLRLQQLVTRKHAVYSVVNRHESEHLPTTSITGISTMSSAHAKRPTPAGQEQTLFTLAERSTIRTTLTDEGGSVAEWLACWTQAQKGKSQSRRCRVTVLGKLFTPIVPLFTKQQNW